MAAKFPSTNILTIGHFLMLPLGIAFDLHERCSFFLKSSKVLGYPRSFISEALALTAACFLARLLTNYGRLLPISIIPSVRPSFLELSSQKLEDQLLLLKRTLSLIRAIKFDSTRTTRCRQGVFCVTDRP